MPDALPAPAPTAPIDGPLTAPLRALATTLQGPARAALLQAAAALDLLPPAKHLSHAVSVMDRAQAELLALQLQQALAQWPDAAAAALAQQRPLNALRDALVQLVALLQWRLRAPAAAQPVDVDELGMTRTHDDTAKPPVHDFDAFHVAPTSTRRGGPVRTTRSAPGFESPPDRVARSRGARPKPQYPQPPTDALGAASPAAAPQAAQAAGAEPAQFHFVLEGPHAYGHQMREHTEAELHFRYEAPPADALATVQHAALDEARALDLNLELHLTPCGAITIVGQRRATVQLQGGQIAAPVQFRLRARAAPSAQAGAEATEEHGVHVAFLIRGETVHQQMLTIQVQPALAPPLPATPPAAANASPGLLADAAAASPPPRHHLRLGLSVDGSSLRMELDHYVNGTCIQSLYADMAARDTAGVADLAGELRAELQDCYSKQVSAWQRFDGTLAEGDTAMPAGLTYALWCAAAAGSRMNEALREDPQVAALLDHVETQAPDGAVLTITTDNVFLPWELMTPRFWSKNMTDHQRANEPPLDGLHFWGARFAIETTPRSVQTGERKLAHLRARPRRVSINLDKAIKVQGLDPERQPLALHQAWSQRLAQSSALDGETNLACQSMRGVLQNAQHQASMIYVYCHGQSAKPFGGSDERLVLEEGCPLTPRDLRGTADYRDAPIVFLNACDTGKPSPFAYASFLRQFCARGAIGLIATTNAVPITFAAHFGPQLVDRYLRCEGALAEMLRQQRREHLVRGNPVPLFYALQCELSFPATSSS